MKKVAGIAIVSRMRIRDCIQTPLCRIVQQMSQTVKIFNIRKTGMQYATPHIDRILSHRGALQNSVGVYELLEPFVRRKAENLTKGFIGVMLFCCKVLILTSDPSLPSGICL